MPELAVVIPTLGRSAGLPRVLDRLSAQQRARGSFELVLVADANAGDLGDIEQVLGELPYPARLLGAQVAGASAARNTGLLGARADLVLFLGDDILPSTALVAEHLDWHERHPDDEVAVLGHVRWARELRVTPFMRWLEHGVQFDYPSIAGTEAGWGRLYTANVSLKRALLERVGGFDEAIPYLYEDLDLGRRLHDLGLRLLYNRRAEGEHLHPVTIESFRRRMAIGAHAERRFTEKHPELPPYFRGRFEAALAYPPGRGRSARLLGLVPRWLPIFGPRVWANADIYFRQQLADAFLSAWDEAEAPGATIAGEAPPTRDSSA